MVAVDILYKIEDGDPVADRRKETGAFRVEEEVASAVYCPQQVGELEAVLACKTVNDWLYGFYLEVCLHVRMFVPTFE